MNVESTIHPQLLESIATIRSSGDRQAEQRAEMAEESERLNKTLFDSISHEIRTPIAVITTAAGTLNAARDPSLTQVPWAMIDEIQEATRRLNRLVGNPLNMTRLQRDWRTKPSNLASNQTGPERCATALLGETEVQYAKCADYETGKSQSILEKTYDAKNDK